MDHRLSHFESRERVKTGSPNYVPSTRIASRFLYRCLREKVHHDVLFTYIEGGISTRLARLRQVAPNGIVNDARERYLLTTMSLSPCFLAVPDPGSFPRRGIPVTAHERVRVVRGQIFLARDRQTHTRHGERDRVEEREGGARNRSATIDW